MNDTLTVRRGDLVIHTARTRAAMIDGPTQEHVSITLGVATSVSRDGQVKQWANPFTRTDTDPKPGRFDGKPGQWTWVGKDRVDVATVMAAYRERTYATTVPGSTSQMVCPFPDMDSVKVLLRAHRR